MFEKMKCVLAACVATAGLTVAAQADSIYFVNFNSDVVGSTPPVGGGLTGDGLRIDRITGFTQGSGRVVPSFGTLTSQPLLLDPARPFGQGPTVDSVAELTLLMPRQYRRTVLRTDVYIGRPAAQPSSFESLRFTFKTPQLTGIEFQADGTIDAFQGGDTSNNIATWDERQRVRVWMDYRQNLRRMRVFIGNRPRAVLNTRITLDQLNDFRLTYTDSGDEINQVAIDGLVLKGFGRLGPPPVDNNPLLGSAGEGVGDDARLGSASVDPVHMPTPSAAAAGLMALGLLTLRRRRA